ncbi:hypothetical protein [Endozoicomonas sp.]|uniref:hypothetical protein n=1 Tax=Endozoicomonas sp. TaxID=1892382 RepID=UPI002884F477|nr:hypothetical protein [Endozoicomonas sp.]
MAFNFEDIIMANSGDMTFSFRSLFSGGYGIDETDSRRRQDLQSGNKLEQVPAGRKNFNGKKACNSPTGEGVNYFRSPNIADQKHTENAQRQINPIVQESSCFSDPHKVQHQPSDDLSISMAELKVSEQLPSEAFCKTVKLTENLSASKVESETSKPSRPGTISEGLMRVLSNTYNVNKVTEVRLNEVKYTNQEAIRIYIQTGGLDKIKAKAVLALMVEREVLDAFNMNSILDKKRNLCLLRGEVANRLYSAGGKVFASVVVEAMEEMGWFANSKNVPAINKNYLPPK